MKCNPKKGGKYDVYGFKMTVMDIVRDGVYVTRGNLIHKVGCKVLKPINKNTIK